MNNALLRGSIACLAALLFASLGACGDEGGGGGVHGDGGGGGEIVGDGGSGGAGGAAPEATPAVTTVFPPDGAVDVPRDVRIRVAFSLPMDRARTEAAVEMLQEGAPVGWTPHWRDGDRLLEIELHEPLQEHARVDLTVSTSATAEEGEPLASEFTSSFTTGDELAVRGAWDSMIWDQHSWQ